MPRSALIHVPLGHLVHMPSGPHPKGHCSLAAALARVRRGECLPLPATAVNRMRSLDTDASRRYIRAI